MQIVDAGVHVWGADTPERPWPKVKTGRAHAHGPPISVEQLSSRMDEAGVDQAILVPPTWKGERNDLALAGAVAHPQRFAVMGRFAPDNPEGRSLLQNWLSQPGMLGIRLAFQPGFAWVTDGSADWFWPAAESLHVPLMVAPQGRLPMVERVAVDHPNLRLVIDHLGCIAGQKDQEAFAHLPDLLRLARLPNVAVKASAMPCYSSDPYPHRNIHDFIHRVFDAFGPQRVFRGSDLSRLTSYRQAVTMFTEELPWLDENAKAWVMGRGV